MTELIFGCLLFLSGTDTTRPAQKDSSFLTSYATREMNYVTEMMSCKTESQFYSVLNKVEINSLAWKYLPFFHPVNRTDLRYTSFFGYRLHPLTGKYKLHKGVDIAASCNTNISAAGGGIIEQAGWDKHLGWFVRINHAFNWTSIYGHLSKIEVKIGEKVDVGQLIGTSGSTGKSTGCHLHYGIYYRQTAVEPVRYFKVIYNLLPIH